MILVISSGCLYDTVFYMRLKHDCVQYSLDYKKTIEYCRFNAIHLYNSIKKDKRFVYILEW